MQISISKPQRRLCIEPEDAVVAVPLDLLVFVGEHMDFLADTAGPDLKIVVNEYGGNFKVLAETAVLRSALFEILINARTAMPNGGDVTFTILPLVVKEDMFLPDGEYIRMSIADRGIGFSLAGLTNVLRRPKPGGECPGLAGFAEDFTGWGGAIRVKLRRSRGTTVHLYLQRAMIH